MQITIEKEVLIWWSKNDLWALVENKMQYYLGDDLFDFLEDIDYMKFLSAPDELNVRGLIYYLEYKNPQLWFLLFRKMEENHFELIRIISHRHEQGKYFFE